MTHDEIIAIVQAHKEGKAIEAKRRNWSSSDCFEWFPSFGTDFNFCLYYYRIKPEPPKPREWWISPMPGAVILRHEAPTEGWIHVREVLSEGEQ